MFIAGLLGDRKYLHLNQSLGDCFRMTADLEWALQFLTYQYSMRWEYCCCDPALPSIFRVKNIKVCVCVCIHACPWYWHRENVSPMCDSLMCFRTMMKLYMSNTRILVLSPGVGTSCQSCSLLWDRSNSTTWAQKAAISAWSPALLIPQPFNTSTLGRFRRSGGEPWDERRKMECQTVGGRWA